MTASRVTQRQRAARTAGRVRSLRKTRAVRENGKKGGRPRKAVPPAARSLFEIQNTAPAAFLWQRIEQALRAHGPLDLAGLKAHVARFVKQATPRRIDAVVLTEMRRRPALFRSTPKGFVVRGPVASGQAACAHCAGPMPAPTPRRQSAPWRDTHCRRWCARAAALAKA